MTTILPLGIRETLDLDDSTMMNKNSKGRNGSFMRSSNRNIHAVLDRTRKF